MPSLKQTIVNKRPWTGAEEKNPSSLEIIEKRFRTQPSDQPTDEPDVSIAESSTESDNDQGPVVQSWVSANPGLKFNPLF